MCSRLEIAGLRLIWGGLAGPACPLPFTCRRVPAGERCIACISHLIASCDIRVSGGSCRGPWAPSHLLPRPMEGRTRFPCSFYRSVALNLQTASFLSWVWLCGPSLSPGAGLGGWLAALRRGRGRRYAEICRDIADHLVGGLHAETQEIDTVDR